MSKSILTAENIIEMREKMGLSRDDLSKMLGVSSKTVARWENLKASEPPAGTSAIILSNLVSNVLNIPLSDGKPELISKMESMHEKAKLRQNPDTIFLLLNEAEEEEKSEICKALKLSTDSDVFEISKEYRSAAGHTVGNWFRGDHDLPYKAILADIANKLRPKKDKKIEYSLTDGRSEEDIESIIIRYFAEKIADELNKMTPEERANKLKAFTRDLEGGENIIVEKESLDEIASTLTATAVPVAGVVTLLTAPLTSTLFYSGTVAGLWASAFGMSSSLLLLTGTGVGTLVAVPILLLVLGSPSYKKTIPTTLQLINIRRRLSQEL